MNRYTFALLIIILMASTACEKVIDINIKNVAQKYVIEAVITDQPGTAKILVSKTKNFSDNNDFVGIENAAISLIDANGNNTTFEEKSPGVYTNNSFVGAPGRTYNLAVKIDNETFTATSRMPAKVFMDSIYITEDYIFGDTRKNVNVEYQDPPGKGQHYRFVQYRNGVKSKEVYIRDDEFTDGKGNLVKLRSPGDDEEQLVTDDVVKVEMLCIDKPVYDYWYSFAAGGASGSSGTASPANPTSNFSGDILGYFSAHTLQSKTITVQ